MYGLKTDWPDEPECSYLTLQDYEGQLPRWCPGCGDHGVLTAMQRLCRDEQLRPEKTSSWRRATATAARSAPGTGCTRSIST
jgi:pyruvate/2-oxoacid:ferredoxin oxidoreductase beta subunit